MDDSEISPGHTNSADFVEQGLPAAAPDAIEQEQGENIDDIVPSRGYSMCPVVGLGGSAGSIPALQKFFAATEPESGMAFVVVLHLAAEHESILDSILAHATKMRVLQAADEQCVEPNTVYVIPPGKFLSLRGERLKVTPLEPERGKRVAVDLFFRALADTHGSHATAIILSGANGDGALGLKRVKERGGLTIVQEPTEAEHPGMPQTALETGMVDWVLPVEQIPARLMEYRANESRLRLPPECGPELPKVVSTATSADESALREILSFLRVRTGRDFSYYKRATIIRRISRRMQVNGTPTMSEYLAYLRTQVGETGALQQDLLISVTNFFRDRDSFAALEELVPKLFAGKGAGDVVRVWTPACATGEEAISVGMLLLEHAAKMESPPAIQIFATDLAEDIIVIAREGLYPSAAQADVSEDRLRRFFVKEPRGYRVRRELRECVLFAVHDVLKDAPFSRLDLITCRNLLIYLNADAQKRVLDIFHFALRQEGTLFLGSSESVDEENSGWLCLDKKHRIFRQRPAAKIGMPVPFGPETLSRAVQAQEGAKVGPFLHGGAFSARAALAAQQSINLETKPASLEELHFKALERFSSPSILVTRDYDIVHASQNAGRLLHFNVGEPSINLLRVVTPMLRVELRAVLFRAGQMNAPVETFNVPLDMDGRTVTVDIRICPAHDMLSDCLLVLFDLHEESNPEARRAPTEAEPAVRHLERENEHLKRRLRDIIEQYEASGEELKAGNEELQAMNEELRSSAEELETSREELQSINEELTTVNQELKTKVDELSKANSDFANLMAATGVATIFLDRNLKIARYTPTAVAIFNLIQTDLGRPLSDLTHKLDYAGLKQDAESVLSSLIPIKREVSDGERWFFAQFMPYRTPEDQILGVVLSFIDISEIRHAQEALRESEERLRLVVENAREYAIISLDLERRVKSWNTGAERLLGYTQAEISNESADLIFTAEDRAAGGPEQEAQGALEHGSTEDERWHVRKDGTRFWGSGSMMMMRDRENSAIGLVKIFRDQTKERQAREVLERSQADLWEALQENERARQAAEMGTRAKDHFMAIVSHELRTPLTPIVMSLHMLERRTDIPPPLLEELAMIKRNVQMEMRFIDELLDASRITHGKLEIVRQSLDLHEIVQRALDVSRPDVEMRKQSVQVNLAAHEHELSGDAQRLQQVFWNLLKNASKFTPEEGVIILSSKNREGAILVEIQDTGVGFEAQEAEALFEAFSQFGQREEETKGLGLGLSIARAIVEGHGGTIRASSPGKLQGAIFAVELPLR